jgi:hypothetical protein
MAHSKFDNLIDAEVKSAIQATSRRSKTDFWSPERIAVWSDSILRKVPKVTASNSL